VQNVKIKIAKINISKLQNSKSQKHRSQICFPRDRSEIVCGKIAFLF